MSENIPTCPTDCSSLLPELLFNYCAPDTAFGQINIIYLTTVNAGGFTDWSDLTEWQARLSNTSAAADAIRYLYVIGAKAAPEYNEIDISLFRKIMSTKKHSITIKIDETSELNYEFLRELECGGQYLMWFAAHDKYLYGGNDGILVSIKLDLIIPESSTELSTFDGTLYWEHKFHPERIENPLL